MSKLQDKLNQIAEIVGVKLKEEEVVKVELETKSLENGQPIEAEAFAPGEAVFAIMEDGSIPVPEGEYELEDGQTLVVRPEGVIESIGEAASEEEEEPAPVEEEMDAETKPKSIVESVVKETKFSLSEDQLNDLASKVADILKQPDFETVVEEIEVPEEEVQAITENIEEKLSKQEAKEEVKEQTKVELEEVKPRKFSPELKKKPKVYTNNKKIQTVRDRVFAKLSQ